MIRALRDVKPRGAVNTDRASLRQAFLRMDVREQLVVCHRRAEHMSARCFSCQHGDECEPQDRVACPSSTLPVPSIDSIKQWFSPVQMLLGRAPFRPSRMIVVWRPARGVVWLATETRPVRILVMIISA